MQGGIFTISLDFELHWGVYDKKDRNFGVQYFINTRNTIPKMLELFGKYGIEVTWATVGMLFCENEEEWEFYKPAHLPSYRNPHISAYQWIKENDLNPQFHFAPDLIRKILETPGQELGSHTYAHYYTLLRGQTPDQFKADLRTAQKIAKDKFGVQLTSLVFPRNHVNQLYLSTCIETGFEQVRINPSSWYWQETQNEGLLKKIIRSTDCYLPVTSKKSYTAQDIYPWENKLWLMPASRLYKPYQKNFAIGNDLKVSRIFGEMETAAKNNEIYHLWWHPHNFGHAPEQAMKELETILAHFRILSEKYGMRSLNMNNTVRHLKSPIAH